MAKRVRLTQRQARSKRAVEDGIPYPGTVNQPDRQFKRRDEYDNWQEVVNHPLPDMRHDWNSDERDDIGFGIPEAWGTSPTTASVKVGAHKAVRLAVLLLGEKTPEEVVEAQAMDFMMLGPEIMDKTLERYAETAKLYQASEEDEEATEASEKPKTAKAEPKKAQDEEEEDEEVVEEATEASEKPKTAKAEPKKAQDEEEEDEEATEASEKPKTAKAEPKKAQDEEEEDEEVVEETTEASDVMPKKRLGEFDIELTGSIDGEDDVDPKTARELGEALFGSDDVEPDLPQVREASEKKGIVKLGGQPRVASAGGAAPGIGDIWGNLDAPDVSAVFN